MKYRILTMTMIAMAAVACNGGQTRVSVPAIDLSNLDTTVAPGQDFYAYATRGWQRNHPLKPEFSRYGSFDVLRENNEIRLNELFQGLAGLKTRKGSVEQKIADLYTMALDSTRLNAEGFAPVKPYYDEIEKVSDAEGFALEAAKLNLGVWSSFVDADLMDSNTNVLYLGQSGLAMGNRDYYLDADKAELRDGYLNFLVKVFTLAGDPEAEKKARDAFDFEMSLAEPFWSMVQQRDIQAQYNPMSSQEVFATYPNMHFDVCMDYYGIPEQEKVIVAMPSFFSAVDALIAQADPAVLRHYLQAQLLTDACGAISDDFYDASFDFFSRQMSGAQEQKPRWKRAMSVPNGILGEAVGEMYVAKYFPEKDKQRMLEIVKNIQTALGQHVAALDWMSDSTKAKAQEKLSSFTVKIGYPDKWKDYSTLEIDPSKSYYENLNAASQWYIKDNLDKLGKPVDKSLWGMTPQTVNAYYNPTTNEICFPAGILQPPFYNPDADDAVNYGAIGVVISHEMTHGFDDQGRNFDQNGNMIDWWTEEDAEKFKALTDKLVAQFDEIIVADDVHANGRFTLGENIADHGGLRVAYTAFKKTQQGQNGAEIDGFTPDQRFFISYANVWKGNIAKEEILRRTKTDPHSLGKWRVNASLRNIEPFFKAFDIKEGDPMYRADRVTIW